MPVTVQEMNSVQATPMAEFYDAQGVTPEILAQKGKELLEAVTPKTYKLNGWFDRTVPMVEGFEVVKGTTSETLIRELLADNGIRFRAWVEICKQRGLYPSESVNVKHSFDRLVGEVVQDILKHSAGVPPLPSDEESE